MGRLSQGVLLLAIGVSTACLTPPSEDPPGADSDSESDSDSEADEFDNMDGKDIYKRYLNMSFTVPQLRHQLKNAGIKGYSRANKPELVERLATFRTE